MPLFPKIKETQTTRKLTDSFLGYDARDQIADGAWRHMENLTGDRYPLLASREPRGCITQLETPLGITVKDALAWVDGGTLYYNGQPTGLNTLSVPDITRSAAAPQGAKEGDWWQDEESSLTYEYTAAGWQSRPYPAKQLVGMGAYLCVFPDKVYINMADLTDYGSMEARFTANEVSAIPCAVNGDALDADNIPIQAEAPADPENGDYWIDISDETHRLMRYSASGGIWTHITTVYTALHAPGIGAAFAQYDGVTVGGCEYTEGGDALAAQAQALNGAQVIYARGDDFVVITGLIDRAMTFSSVTLERAVPRMDYVIQCGNRLWGCYYGMAEGKTVNEIYCSALGDFKNWRRYMGISTDSWAAGVGSDGPWTGAANYLGSPVFFKEDHIHTVTVSASGAHQVDELAARGVQKGSARSLAMAGETLFYKARDGVCAYQGGLPVDISAPLGRTRYSLGCGGAVGDKYYISMHDGGGWNLFVYDSARGLWHREDATHAIGFAAMDGDLICLASDGRVIALMGSAGEREGAVEFEAVGGIQHYYDPEHKYLSRYSLRLGMAEGAQVTVWLRYDSQGEWEDCGSISIDGTDTVTLPVRPRRCDHLQLRLTGRGPVLLYSIAAIYEKGGDEG